MIGRAPRPDSKRTLVGRQAGGGLNACIGSKRIGIFVGAFSFCVPSERPFGLAGNMSAPNCRRVERACKILLFQVHE